MIYVDARVANVRQTGMGIYDEYMLVQTHKRLDKSAWSISSIVIGSGQEERREDATKNAYVTAQQSRRN